MFFLHKQYPHEFKEKKAAPSTIVGEPMPKQLNTPAAWKAMAVYLKERHLNCLLATANGWYPSQDANDHELRIVMPATNSKKYNYWQARAVNKTATIRYQSPRTPRTDSIIAVYPSTTPWSAVVLVEGPCDALAAAGLGYTGIALMGNAPSSDVLSFIVSHTKAALFYIIADADAPGAAATIAAHLTTVHGAKTKTLLTYPAKDLADCSHELREMILNNA